MLLLIHTANYQYLVIHLIHTNNYQAAIGSY